MDAVDYILESYEEDDGCCKRCCTMCCGGCCCPEQKAALKKKYFFKKWPEVQRADDPDNIKWENLGVSSFSRRIRVCITWLIALCLILGTLLGIIFMKDWASELKENYSSNTVICPEGVDELRLKQLAWNDQHNPPDQRTGIMHCYCSTLKKSEIAKESTKPVWADVGGELKMIGNYPPVKPPKEWKSDTLFKADYADKDHEECISIA